MTELKKKRCFSSCRKRNRTECRQPTCAYTRGKKRQFCRLNSKLYYLDKNDCDQKPKHFFDKEAKRIQHVWRNHKKRMELKQKDLKQISKTKKGRKIQQFMRRTRGKRIARFLSSICSDSGVCIALGTESEKIKSFFHGFTPFDYTKDGTRRLGAPSNNGFVREITYQKYNYIAHSVLKSSSTASADNLMYEYNVGLYINKKAKQFPCFLETYGMFHYKTEAEWDIAKGTNLLSMDRLKNALTPMIRNSSDYNFACYKSKYLAVLIQHLKDADTLYNTIIDNDYDYASVLLQVYMVLSSLENEYTHYDLHANNVLCYQPVKGKYIEYHYHFDSEIISFPSKYMAKIIDYGRCFFHDSEQNNSKAIYKKICGRPFCNPNCGEDVGFMWLGEKRPNAEAYWICPQFRNKSHDLKLLNGLPALGNTLKTLRSKMVYSDSYGTKEIPTSGLPDKIHNVTDMAVELFGVITTLRSSFTTKQENKLGDLHVYMNGRPMKFVSVK